MLRSKISRDRRSILHLLKLSVRTFFIPMRLRIPFVDAMAAYRVSTDESNYPEVLGQLINDLELAVNSYSVNYNAIIETMKDSKEGYSNLIQLSYEWIEFWSDTDERNTDPRNEASTRL